jgi:hypothetical protein
MYGGSLLVNEDEVQLSPKEVRSKGPFPSSARSDRTSRTRFARRRGIFLKFNFFRVERLQPIRDRRAFLKLSELLLLKLWSSKHSVNISRDSKPEFASV